MANRVNVNINANDLSRRGINSLRRSMDRMQRDARRAGGTIQFNVRVDPGSSRRELRRLQRQMRGRPVNINARLDPQPPPSGLLRRLRATLGRGVGVPVRVRINRSRLLGPFRALGGLVSGTMQDGVAQGIFQGFKSGGPLGIAFLATLLLSAAAVLGAALSGILVTALGGAFVGIGLASAFQSKQVQHTWSRTLANIKKEFEGVGEPLIPVLDEALKRLHEMAHKAGPALKEALEKTAPATEKFINSLMDGFESFGENAFDRIMESWNVFAPVFGEQWDEFMGELGDAFGDMADLVAQHPEEIAMALEIVFEALELIVRTVTFLGETWVNMVDLALTAVSFLGKGIEQMGLIALTAFEAVINGAVSAFGWIPGVGDQLKTAQEAFKEFKKGAEEDLHAIASAGDVAKEALDRMNKKRKLEADISSWQSQLSKARADLKKTTSQKARAKLAADIADLMRKTKAARAQLAALNGKTATTYVKTVYTSTSQGGHPTQRRKATGGVIGAAATGGVRSNLTMVGEAGPELVRLPAGSSVRSNPDTRRIMNERAVGGAGQLVFKSSGRRVDDLLLEILREAIHDRGGDPVVVLGG